MTRFNSLLGRNKFPVPMRRELARKSLNLALDSGRTIHPGGALRTKYPVYSQLAGNLKTASHTKPGSRIAGVGRLRAFRVQRPRSGPAGDGSPESVCCWLLAGSAATRTFKDRSLHVAEGRSSTRPERFRFH